MAAEAERRRCVVRERGSVGVGALGPGAPAHGGFRRSFAADRRRTARGGHSGHGTKFWEQSNVPWGEKWAEGASNEGLVPAPPGLSARRRAAKVAQEQGGVDERRPRGSGGGRGQQRTAPFTDELAREHGAKIATADRWGSDRQRSRHIRFAGGRRTRFSALFASERAGR